MKKIINIFVFSFVMALSLMLFGCKGDRFIVFSTKNPTHGLKKQDLIADFKIGQKVYFSIISRNGFEDDLVKIQILKKDPKSEFWGYSYLFDKTEKTNGKQYYSNYIVPSEAGYYIVRTFELKNLKKPIATGMFRVND